MYRIAKAESVLKATAYNPEWHYNARGEKICQGSYGLLQVACIHHLENPQALFNPEFNLQVASRVLRSSGLRAWGVCHKQNGLPPKVECF